ncbi:TPA: putative zinc ribbon protein [Providencia rettgeri]
MPALLYISQQKHISAQEAAKEALRQYICPHYQGKLTLENYNVEYWFIHLDNEAEQKCIYCQAEFNKLFREQELANWGRWLPPLIKVTHWYCVLCQYNYMGLKQCPCCQQGIYSIAIDNN